MVIFHSYVSLPEGITPDIPFTTVRQLGPLDRQGRHHGHDVADGTGFGEARPGPGLFMFFLVGKGM